MTDWVEQTPRDEDFKKHVREGACDICLENDAQHAHHLESGAMGTKCSDYTCIGACARCHRLIHQKGARHVEEKYNCNLWKKNSRHLRTYFVD